MMWIILFTLAVLCILFWFGVLGAVIAGIGYLLYYVAVATFWVVVTVVGSAIWLAWFCFQPQKALAAYHNREQHFHLLPETKRYRKDPMPPVKIYRAKR